MEKPGTARTVGLFVVVALALLALLILQFSKGANMWTPKFQVTVESQNVGGLKKGASVLMSGVPVGMVEAVELAADGRRVQIHCNIEKRYVIHGDARWEIEQSGFLGDQFVSIVPGLNEKPGLADGVVVQAQQPFNLQEAARSAVGLMQRLDATASKLDSAVGRVDRILLSEATLSDLTNSFASLRHLSDKADQALTDIQLLVRTNAPAVGITLSNVTVFSQTLTGVATNLNAVVDANKATLQSSLMTIQSAAADLKSVTSDLQAGRGLAGAILKDDGMRLQFRGMVSDLGVLSSNLSHHGILWKPKSGPTFTNSTIYTGRSPFR